ncbi:MAG: cytochrome c [Verrucomicrobia bacterium]|nr:cytochrome c [Verrucomicrobiota bacterium]
MSGNCPRRASLFVDALESLLAGRTIDEPIVDTVGCRLTFPVRDKHQKDGLTYEKDVAPILMTKCVGCHSKGGIGPFALSSHRKVVGWSEMMEEVLLNRRMPPWQADPHYGRFQHSLSLTAEERQVLLHWLGGSMDRDQSVEDPLEQNIPVHKEWALGTPDQVIPIPEQTIAATGIMDYLHIQMDLPFDQDVWVKGYDIRPGNTKVLHHIIAYILEMHDGQWERRGFLAGYAPGMGPEEFPLNSGVLLKQGQKLEFELHYTTCGTPEVDQSQMGLYLHKTAPEKTLHTGIIMDDSFRIPPQDGNFKHSRTTRIKQDIVLYSMNPHMHLRGKAMRFRVKMPDKSEQILLSVPDYNFNWQRNYRLTDPLRIPGGSVLTVDAAWDNSPLNTANPDPSRQVGWGDQSFDEMFFATYHFTVEAAENSSKSQFSLAD